MPAMRPEELHPAFTTAFNAGDTESILALYEPEATLMSAPGKAATGTDAIRAAVGGFLALKGTMTVETGSVVISGDTALLHGSWVLKGTGPDGKPVELSGQNTEVARRQPDGRWLFTIDNPFAGA
ncbi:MAG: SgcJ/EcaC family oxidoreductase [Chloroflexota bacterium]